MNHLQKHNISYFAHMKHSLYYSYQSIKASTFFFIHAFIPDIFEYSGSKTIRGILNIIEDNSKSIV